MIAKDIKAIQRIGKIKCIKKEGLDDPLIITDCSVFINQLMVQIIMQLLLTLQMQGQEGSYEHYARALLPYQG